MRALSACAVGLVLFGSAACYRTHYLNFSPANPSRTAAGSAPVRVMGWQSFFLYSWVPDERIIDALALCGGPQNIHSVATRRTFPEGLVATFSNFIVNLYSPWNGAVYCREQPAPP